MLGNEATEENSDLIYTDIIRKIVGSLVFKVILVLEEGQWGLQ